MKYLLDVNVLIAWGWSDHDHHLIVSRWISNELEKNRTLFLTSSIIELGFVRISGRLFTPHVTPENVTQELHKMLRGLAPSHRFLSDDLTVRHWPAWCNTASQTTDAHLFLLAKKHGAQLATLDQKIPGAFLIK